MHAATANYSGRPCQHSKGEKLGLCWESSQSPVQPCWPQTRTACLCIPFLLLFLCIYFGGDLLPDTISPGLFPEMTIKGPTWLPEDNSAMRYLLSSKEKIFSNWVMDTTRLIGRQQNATPFLFIPLPLDLSS